MYTQRQSLLFDNVCRRLAVLLSVLVVALTVTAQEAEPAPGVDSPEGEVAAETTTPAAPETAAARKVPDLEQRDMALLAAVLPPAAVRWLEADGDRFLAIYEADHTGNPQGAILMLHAEGLHPAAQATLEAIRRQLPRYGWATLAAMLPSPGSPPVPPRPPPAPAAIGDDPAPSGTDPEAAAGESDEIFDETTGGVTDGREPPAEPAAASAAEEEAAPAKPVEQQVTERLQAALQFLQEEGIFNVVILGQGVGAARAAEFYRLQQAPAASAATPMRALLLVNARNTVPLTDIDLPASLTDPALPVLDIYYDADPRNQLEAQQRQRQAQRQRLSHFVQLRLPRPAPGDGEQNRLTRRVRGFLEKHAAGMEIDRP